MKIEEFKAGFRDGIPIGMGYFSVAFAFGMQAVLMGIEPWVAVTMSLTNLTSAGQFAALPLLVNGGTLMELALTQFIINLRYALMSLSLSQKLKPETNGMDRMIIAFGNTDEIFAMASARAGKVDRFYMFGIMVLPILMWTGGTLAGVCVNTLLPASIQSALGIAIYGMFLAIFIPPMKKQRSVQFVVGIAVGLSCLFAVVPMLKQVSSGFVIIVCTIVSASLGATLFPLKKEGKNG